jgi:hypothetical protein
MRNMLLDSNPNDYADEGLVLFLFAVFTADWAHTTRRNPWLWFFLGLCLGPIAGLALLYKNGRDRESAEAAGRG